VTDVGPPLALCLVWCTWQADAGWSHRPAHWQCWSRRVTALRIPAGMFSAYPMSSGRLGPAEAGAELPAAQEARQAAGPGQQVNGLADDSLLERGPGRGGVRSRRAGAVAVAADPV